jgi:alkanesulfonate monooxygenase SsuD/methylene tetrahydromethanopterin reductase-like flavin-dependent oxidoreductase (luciferase family)
MLRFHSHCLTILVTGGLVYALRGELLLAPAMILEDICMVSDAYGGSFETSLKHAVFAPKHDPIPLVPLIAQATSRLGVVGSMSTSFYPPFLLARLSATLDHICQGRFGWNIVTSGEDRAAQNFAWRN